MNLIGDKLIIFNKHIKNGNIKLCGSSPLLAIVFCITRTRLKNSSVVFLLIYSMPCSFIKIQDTKFEWCVLRNLLINGNFEYFKNVF